MAGNTVVLKPAQLTPWSGSEYGRIVAEETDIPAGVFNVVVSNANEAGAPTVKRRCWSWAASRRTSCSTTRISSRILLPRSRYDEGLAILKGAMENFQVGDPWTPGNMQGPQISETQRQKVLGLIKSGIDSGRGWSPAAVSPRTFRRAFTCSRRCWPTSIRIRRSPRRRSWVRR
jgi:acyl-CoA reductase-like NAD-dependent aldehyde dehydrogenase